MSKKYKLLKAKSKRELADEVTRLQFVNNQTKVILAAALAELDKPLHVEKSLFNEKLPDIDAQFEETGLTVRLMTMEETDERRREAAAGETGSIRSVGPSDESPGSAPAL